jgi:hypothetical protein
VRFWILKVRRDSWTGWRCPRTLLPSTPSDADHRSFWTCFRCFTFPCQVCLVVCGPYDHFVCNGWCNKNLCWELLVFCSMLAVVIRTLWSFTFTDAHRGTIYWCPQGNSFTYTCFFGMQYCKTVDKWQCYRGLGSTQGSVQTILKLPTGELFTGKDSNIVFLN